MRSRTLIVLGLFVGMMNSAMADISEDVLLISTGKPLGKIAPDVQWHFGGGTRDQFVSILQENQQVPLVADLYLSGGKLGEPIARALSFHKSGNGDFPNLCEGAFSLELPKLEKPVQMLLIIRRDTKDNDKGHDVASIPLMVCPDTFLTRISKRFFDEARAGHSLHFTVFGKMKGLRELLTSRQVPFEDIGEDFPSQIPAGTVAVGDLSPDLPLPSSSLSPGASLLVFHKDHVSPEQITITSQDRRLETVVHCSPPTNWADDAKAQKLLFDIIEKTPALP